LHVAFLIFNFQFVLEFVSSNLILMFSTINAGMIISQIVLVALFAAALVLALVIVAVSRHQKAAMGELDLMGALASVETTLEPEGSVLIRGELWRARSRTNANVARGQTVRVVGASSHLLEVEPLGNAKLKMQNAKWKTKYQLPFFTLHF
jgi:membrane-bound serine protease (ClpP class)